MGNSTKDLSLEKFLNNISSSQLNLFDWQYYLGYEDVDTKIEKLGLKFFKSEESFLTYVSSFVVGRYLASEPLLQDEKLYDTNDWDSERSYKCPYRLPQIDVEEVGLESFAIGYSKSIMTIRYSEIPIYERHAFNLLIWNTCIDNVYKSLCKKSAYKMTIVEVNGIKNIMLFNKVEQINTINQLKIFIWKHCRKSLYLLNHKMQNYQIKIPARYFNIPLSQLPRNIDLEIFIEKHRYIEGLEYCNPPIYKKKDLSFQVIRNADMSLTLVPEPDSLVHILQQQILLQRQYIEPILDEYDENSNEWMWSVPNRLYFVLKYLMNHHIDVEPMGKIKKICTRTQSLVIAKELDREAWEQCDIDEWGVCINAPSSSWENEIRDKDSIIVFTE